MNELNICFALSRAMKHRGSYLSAHVLLNLLTRCEKVLKFEACQACYHFYNEFNKFNNTGARRINSIYHMTLKLF